MSHYEVNTTYEPFSKEPEYIQANRELIATLDLSRSKRILDLACGTGVMTDLILEVYPEMEIVGVDLSRESLLLARQHFLEEGIFNPANSGGNGEHQPKKEKGTVLCLLEGTADTLPLKDLTVDSVIMGNSIHLLPNEEILLGEIRRVLRPGGTFAFNSSFYAGTMPEGTEKFHHEWVKQAAMYINKWDRELREQGLPGIKRKRGTARQAFAKRWPSADDWREMLTRQDFTIKNVFERTVPMNQRCFETIGAYAGLASVLFSGYPVHIASEALQATAGPSLKTVGMEIVPRYWLEITTERK